MITLFNKTVISVVLCGQTVDHSAEEKKRIIEDVSKKEH
jgi:hypothetical protein